MYEFPKLNCRALIVELCVMAGLDPSRVTAVYLTPNRVHFYLRGECGNPEHEDTKEFRVQ